MGKVKVVSVSRKGGGLLFGDSRDWVARLTCDGGLSFEYRYFSTRDEVMVYAVANGFKG